MMITPDYCRLMADYNKWQNSGYLRIVEAMPKAELDEDSGAFFGSIRATLNHLLWGDHIWISRFDGGEGPKLPPSEHKEYTPTIAAWGAERFRMDGRIGLWAERVKALDLTSDLTWHSGVTGRYITKPMSVLVVGFFNHQTHHRGQVHAMLTAAGRIPPDTDLFLMPE